MCNEGMVLDDTLSPPVGRVELVGSLDGSKGSLDEVASSSSGSLGFGVDIMNTSEVEELLGDGRSDQTSSSGSRDQSNLDGSALSGDLDGDGVSATDLVAPISLSHGDDVELGHGDGSLDGALDFFVAFPSETNVVPFVTNNGVSFEAGSLTGLGLLLDGLDLHDLLLDVVAQESVDDFLFLDGDGESEDVDNVFDLLALDQSAELGDGFPLGFFFLSLGPLASLLVVSGSSKSSISSAFGLRGVLGGCWGNFSHKMI